MSLKDRLATALSQRPGLTQAGLATDCGITRASVNAWVHGKTDLQVALFQEAFDEISKKVMDKIAPVSPRTSWPAYRPRHSKDSHLRRTTRPHAKPPTEAVFCWLDGTTYADT